MGKIIPLAVSILLTLASFAAAQSSGDVDIASGDGTNLRGTYYSPDRTGPVILLLHQCNLTRAAWRPLGAALAAAGLHALAVDLRGFGESGGKPTDDVGRRELAGKWSADVDSMLKFLVSQPGVDRTRLGVGGASCGVPLASALAAKNRDMKALLVMSGPANDDGIRHVART